MSSEILRAVIPDSTCLIVLSKIGLLGLLRRTFGTITITPEVRDEFSEELPPWIQVAIPDDSSLKLPLTLGRGESSILRFARHSKNPVLLILDDKNARAFAKKLGFPFIGTLGALLEAKTIGIIENIRPFILKIVKRIFFLTMSSSLKFLTLQKKTQYKFWDKSETKFVRIEPNYA